MFKSIDRREYTASNGNTVRLDADADGSLKVNARKGNHNQSVSVLSPADAADAAAWIIGTLSPADKAAVLARLTGGSNV